MFVDPAFNARKSTVHSPRFGYGRFVEPDPIGYEAGPNLYAYVNNDPVNFTDPLGFEACHPDSAVCAPRCPMGWSCFLGGVSFIVDMVFRPPRLSRGDGGGSGAKVSPITELAKETVCRITSFSGGGDFALGFGPVLRGSAGVQWNRRTGSVSWYRSLGVGYGAAFAGGVGGAISNQERVTGSSQTTNAQIALGGGLSVAQSGNETSVQVSAGPRVGAELSSTENRTAVGGIYLVGPAGCGAGRK